MRITNLMSAKNLVEQIQDNQEQIFALQEQNSTGKKFQAPSDDPLDASASMKLNSALQISHGYQSTASLVNDWMSASDSSLGQLEDLANNAINIVLSGLDDTKDGTDRTSAMATELSEIIHQAVDLGNTKYKDSYIFSGTNISTQAFALDDSDTLTYNGNSNLMVRGIGQSSNVTMNVVGSASITPLIQAMIDAKNQLSSGDLSNLPDTLETLQNAFTSLSSDRTANGARARQVTNTISAMKDSDITLKSLLSEKEDANLTEAAALLKTRQTTLESVLEVGSRTLSALNLFDYLQQ